VDFGLANHWSGLLWWIFTIQYIRSWRSWMNGLDFVIKGNKQTRMDFFISPYCCKLAKQTLLIRFQKLSKWFSFPVWCGCLKRDWLKRMKILNYMLRIVSANDLFIFLIFILGLFNFWKSIRSYSICFWVHFYFRTSCYYY